MTCVKSEKFGWMCILVRYGEHQKINMRLLFQHRLKRGLIPADE